MNPSFATTAHKVPEKISDQDFSEIVRITLNASGISIDNSKRPMIYARFSRRLRDLKLQSFADYIELLRDTGSAEYTTFINTVTTNLTYFFREPHHFDFLETDALPALIGRNRKSKTLRFWSSACSSGQEAYSIAMTLAKSPQTGDWTNKILATDIDTEMVEHCAKGCYKPEALRGLNPEQQSRWMRRDDSGAWQVQDEIKKLVVPKQLNLFSSWPFRKDVDVIFCRNALIYFDEAHQTKLLKRFAEYQTPGAYLFLGHSESIKSTSLPYKRVSNTVYERI